VLLLLLLWLLPVMLLVWVLCICLDLQLGSIGTDLAARMACAFALLVTLDFAAHVSVCASAYCVDLDE
jgi:hypothetical protein